MVYFPGQRLFPLQAIVFFESQKLVVHLILAIHFLDVSIFVGLFDGHYFLSSLRSVVYFLLHFPLFYLQHCNPIFQLNCILLYLSTLILSLGFWWAYSIRIINRWIGHTTKVKVIFDRHRIFRSVIGLNVRSLLEIDTDLTFIPIPFLNLWLHRVNRKLNRAVRPHMLVPCVINSLEIAPFPRSIHIQIRHRVPYQIVRLLLLKISFFFLLDISYLAIRLLALQIVKIQAFVHFGGSFHFDGSWSWLY